MWNELRAPTVNINSESHILSILCFRDLIFAVFQGSIDVLEGSERKSVEQKAFDGRVSHLSLSCLR